jgi:hypothetical protein
LDIRIDQPQYTNTDLQNKVHHESCQETAPTERHESTSPEAESNGYCVFVSYQELLSATFTLNRNHVPRMTIMAIWIIMEIDQPFVCGLFANDSHIETESSQKPTNELR